jgi:thiol-disulfide isomerase/thioredoxin
VQRYRVRAPELTSRGGWFNTGARALKLADLRGRVVILDFWTAGCANCWHVLDELRPLESRYGEVLAVIGIHSPKFAHEGEDDSVAAAVQRNEVHHPVLSDPDMALWRQYAVKAWPTLVLIDPEGYVVAQAAGEGQVSGLARIIDELIIEFGPTLRRGEDAYVAPDIRRTDLRFPSKAIRLADSLLVADTGHHQLVQLDLDATTVLRRIGTGERGHSDGAVPSFAEPSAVALLPDGRLVVADTANHALRVIDGDMTSTVRLTDRGLRTITGDVPSVLSPVDVLWWPAIGRVVVAAAGVHLLLTWDPSSDDVAILAGTTVEGVRDGAALDGWLAQPSGLAVDGDRLWFVDAESSTLRSLDGGRLRTHVGAGLFDFGHVDGPATIARLQHPLGVAVLGDGSIAIADTYNGAIRRYTDSADGDVSTIASGLAEPSGVLEIDGGLVVVESAAHRLVRPVAAASQTTMPMRATRPVTALAAGDITLVVEFTPPPGRKLDDRDGPSTRLSVSASPPELLPSGFGESTELARRLTLAPGDGVLNVTAQAAACDNGGENPACYISRQDWGVPIAVGDGPDELRLVLMA